MLSPERQQFMRLVWWAILCGVGAIIFLAVIWIVSLNPESYAASLSHKFSRLESAPQPRLILVGGSGVAIEVDSPEIYKATKLHPINMGLYAGLGLRFILRIIDDKVKDDDVILLIPEHAILQQPPYGSGHLLLETLHENPTYIPDALTYHSLTIIVRHFPGWFQLKVRDTYKNSIEPFFFARDPSLATRLYSIHNFNAYGDVDSTIAGDTHITTEEILEGEEGYVGPMNAETLALLKNSIESLEKRGARVYVAWAPLSQTIYELNPKLSRARYKQLAEVIGADRIIGTPEDFLFPDEQFLDGATHLTHIGKKDFTHRLIQLLLPAIKNRPL